MNRQCAAVSLKLWNETATKIASRIDGTNCYQCASKLDLAGLILVGFDRRFRYGLLGPQQFPAQGNSVRDVLPGGAFAHVQGQHSAKGAGARLEYLHGALP